MKKLLSIILVSVMLLSVFTSCQGSEPTKPLETLPNTKPITSEKTENKTLPLTQETTEEKNETLEQPNTQEKEMTLDDAKRIIKKLSKDIANDPDKDFGDIDPKVAEAINLVTKSLIVNYSLLDSYISIYNSEETVDAIYDYFSKLHQWIGEQKKADPGFVFELPEDGLVKYIDGGFVSNGVLWSHSDYGTNKEFTVDRSITHIMSKAFSGNTVLEKINGNINNSELYICEGTFNNCPSLKTIDLVGNYSISLSGYREDYVDSLYCFGSSYELRDNYDTPIESQYNEMLEKYTAAFNNVNVVDNDPEHFVIIDGVLMAYLGIGGHVEIPEGVTRINGNVFEHCNREILSLKLPSTLKSLETWNILGLEYLLELEIPDSVEYIAEDAILTPTNKTEAYKPFIKITNIPEDCKVSENAFGDNELQKEAADHYNPNINYVKSR